MAQKSENARDTVVDPFIVKEIAEALGVSPSDPGVMKEYDTNKFVAKFFQDQEDHAAEHEKIIHDALAHGYKVLNAGVYLGIDNFEQSFKEFLPDGSARWGVVTEHLDGSKDSFIRYLDPAHMQVLGQVNTHTENGVETVVKVTENVPGSIDLKEGDTRPAPADKDSAAGLVPNSWNPQHDDNSGSTSGKDEQHDNTGQTGTSSSSETTSTDTTDAYANCGPAVATLHNGPDTNHEWQDQGVSRSCTETKTTVEVVGPDSERGSGTPGGQQSGTDTDHNTDTSNHGTQDSNDNNHDSDNSNNDNHHNDGDDNHDDNKDDTKDETPASDDKGDMPNPDDGGGSPNSTPDPDGDGSDGEGSHRGPTLNQGSSVGHLSTQLAAVGNSEDSAGSDSYHGPKDPGEEMPNPEDTGGGNPVANVAHGAAGFWDQATSATQGATGAQLSTAAVTVHASESQLAFNAAATSILNDVSGAHADASAHAAADGHDLAASGAALHDELGTVTLHDTLTLSGGTFATQMHV